MSGRTFEECKADLEKKSIDKLDDLFELWREAHVAEVEEIKKKIEEEKKNKECDGRIFQEKIYNQCTISSHFIQFFYRDRCKECVEMQEDKTWEYVLKKAFNKDGYVEGYGIPKEGYKYILLLKEANDSSKNCTEKNYRKEALFNQWLLDWKEWTLDRKEEKKSNYRMLNKLNKAFEIFLEKISFEFFFEKIAYMNVNKRGGASTTGPEDQEAIINYAQKYREFILKEIELLSDSEEVTVFVCGDEKYFKRLMIALFPEEKEEIQKHIKNTYPKGKFKFIKISHPSYRKVTHEQLAQEMQGEIRK